MRLIIAVVALLALVNAQSGVNEPLYRLPTAESQNGRLEIDIHLSEFLVDAPGFSVWVRAYNPSDDKYLPGPTLVVSPGDQLVVNYYNDLGPMPPNQINEPNTYLYPNTTNLHTHGLFTSPLLGSDYVLLKLQPGEMFTYVYNISVNQPQGATLWYHPHDHGTSTIQVGMGATGAIVVRDVDDSMPAELAAMEDIVVLANYLDYEEISWVGSVSDRRVGDQYADYRPDLLTASWKSKTEEPLEGTVLINGQVDPVLTMRPGEFKRLRLIAGFSTKNAFLTHPQGCTIHTISQDGNYFDAPETHTKTIIPAGSRVDWIISCEPGEYAITSDPTAFEFVAPAEFTMFTGWGNFQYHNPQVGKWFTIKVEGEPMVPAMSAPTTLPLRPESMRQDLNEVEDGEIDSWCSWKMHIGYGFVPPTPNQGAYGDAVSFGINQRVFSHDRILCKMEQDRVQEWVFIGDQKHDHPFHVHTYQYQVVDYDYEQLEPNLRGKWRDTIAVPHGRTARVRFITEEYSGAIVIHCHFLTHEDVGMMSLAYTGTPTGHGEGGHETEAPEPTDAPAEPTPAPTQAPAPVAPAPSSSNVININFANMLAGLNA